MTCLRHTRLFLVRAFPVTTRAGRKGGLSRHPVLRRKGAHLREGYKVFFDLHLAYLRNYAKRNYGPCGAQVARCSARPFTEAFTWSDTLPGSDDGGRKSSGPGGGRLSRGLSISNRSRMFCAGGAGARGPRASVRRSTRSEYLDHVWRRRAKVVVFKALTFTPLLMTDVATLSSGYPTRPPWQDPGAARLCW